MQVNKIIGFFFVLFVLFFEQNIFSQDSITVCVKLEKTTSGFIVVKDNVSCSTIKNSYYQEKLYVDKMLRSVSIFDPNNNLNDDTYSNAVTLFEYNKDTLKYIKLFDRNNHRVEDGFRGYWSIELSYDRMGKIRMETFRDTSNNLVKYYPNIDFKPPYLEYEYLDNNKCIRKWYDNSKNIKLKDTCDCPIYDYKYVK
jgi:hypothetical protein